MRAFARARQRCILYNQMKITALKRLLFPLLIVLTAICGKAQGNLDSLYHVWQDPTRPDSIRVNAFRDIIWDGYLYSKPDTVEEMAQALHEFADSYNYPRAAAIGFSLMGLANNFQGNHAQAIEYLEESVSIYKELGHKVVMANRLNDIGSIYYNQGNYIEALKYRQACLVAYEELQDAGGVSGTLYNIGLVYFSQGDYPRALEYYEKAKLAMEKSDDQKWLAEVIRNIGGIYFVQNNYPRALEYYVKSLAIREEIGDVKGVASSMISIGNIYNAQGNYTRALDYYQRSLSIYDEIEDKHRIANGFNSIGIVYANQDSFDVALEYYEKARLMNEQLGNQHRLATNLNNIGNIYRDRGDYNQAYEYYQMSLAIFEELGDRNGIAYIMNNIGVNYQKQGAPALAIDFCRKAFTLAEEIGVLEPQKLSCECLYEAYKALGKGNEALLYLEKMTLIKDSLRAEETAKKLEQMEFAKVMLQDSIARVEGERLVREAHQAEVRKKNQTRNLFIGSSCLLLLLAGGFYSRWRYVRKSRAIIESERDRSDHLLLNILPAEIAAELKDKGRTDARNFDMVSILFTDFKDFTEQSEKMTASQLVDEINHCFEAFDGIIEKYGIEKIKTIGDAYMAAGGLPVPTDDSVKNTVLAAIEMQEYIKIRKTEKHALGQPAFEMRVGIHTGPVVAGIVGVKKFQYDVWGDTVNTASRMESSGEVGKVNISQSTYEFVKDEPQLAFESRGKVAAKGKGEVEMWFVSHA